MKKLLIAIVFGCIFTTATGQVVIENNNLFWQRVVEGGRDTQEIHMRSEQYLRTFIEAALDYSFSNFFILKKQDEESNDNW